MSKKTLILTAALIISIVLAYAYQGPLKKWRDNLGQPENIFAKIKADSIDKIEIIDNGKSITLAKQNQKWKYGGSKDFYADSSAMLAVFDELKSAAKSKIELVSNNKQRKSEFETHASGIEVKIYMENKIAADFIAGKHSGDYKHSYFALPESAITYEVKADLQGVFSRSEWRDLTIFSGSADKIGKIRFQYPDREFTVEMKDGQWAGILPWNFAVSEEKIRHVLSVMSDLKAVEIPDQVFANTGLEKHLIIIQASGHGVDNILMVGHEDKNGLYYAKRGDSDNIYLISKSERDELDKRIWRLK